MLRFKHRRFRWLIGGLSLLALAGFSLWLLVDDQRGSAWAVSVIRDRFPDIQQISSEALQERLREPKPPVILDVRDAEEYALSHLPGAVHLPEKSVTEAELRALDPAAEYIVYCSAGYRSCQLARRLKTVGVEKVSNLEGGIFAWANAGKPAVRDGEEVQEVHPYHALFSRLLKAERRPQ